MKDLLNPDDQNRAYRDLLKAIVPPCIPHVAMLLTDIIYIDERYDNFVGEAAMVNVHKHRMTYRVIESFTRYQKVPYNLIRIPELGKIIDDIRDIASTITDDIMYQISLELEPRGWDGTSQK